MATNPNSAIGTNGAYSGRTSVNAFNDVLGAFSRGVLNGWACTPNSGLTVSLGGSGTTRDVAIAEDNAGNRTTINNISGSPVDVTMSAAPASNTRIDAIVAYVDNPPTGNSSVADNPGACGIIAVDGTPSASPVGPNESAIRTAITADGASGTTAYYVVLATVTITAGTTDITADDITAGSKSQGYWENVPLPVRASGENNQIENTTVRTKITEVSVSGLDPDWEYLAIANLGLANTSAGVGLIDIDSGTNVIVPAIGPSQTGRIRVEVAQTSPSWTAILQPTASSLVFNVNGRMTNGSARLSIEDPTLTFIPLRKVV